MKLNKKVFAGALALAMGLGVVAPAANSYAADAEKKSSAEELIQKDYDKARKAFEDEVVKAAELLASVPEKEKALEEAKEMKDNLDKEEAAQTTLDAIYALAVSDKYDVTTTAEYDNNKDNAAVKAAKKLYEDAVEAYEAVKNLDVADKDNAESYMKLSEDAKADYLKGKTEEEKATLFKAIAVIENAKTTEKNFKDAAEKYNDTKATLDVKKKEAEKKVKDAQDALNYAKGYDRSATYLAARNDFLAAGASIIQIKEIEKAGGVDVPEFKPSEDEKDDLTEKIEASLKVNKEKLSALKAVKEYMPESYKKYKKVIDEAVEVAEKAIKQAEDFLGKDKDKVALFTVAYASDVSAEDVLKDLEDSEKKLDDAINQVEQDNKEQNEAEEEKPEEEKPEEKPEEEKPEEKPEVTEKEDKTPSKNVKTGVAGVAGVGAVLAAASAAYVSSKRK